MKVSQILDKIDENQLFVPAFQREYVWKRDDVKKLLSSLIKDYPTGTMLTWETNDPPELKGKWKYDHRFMPSALSWMPSKYSCRRQTSRRLARNEISRSA